MAEKNQNKRSVKNIFAPENKKTLFVITGVAACIGAYALYMSNSGSPEPEIPLMQSNIEKTAIEIKEDKLGQTTLTTETKQIEAEIKNQKVIDTIESGRSAIMEREGELKTIAYTPKKTLEVVKVPEVETPKIEVEKAQETTPVQTETNQQEVENIVESYRAPSYAQQNRAQIDALKTKMATLQLGEQNQDNRGTPFTPTEFSYFTTYKASKEEAKAKALELSQQSALLASQMATQPKEKYQPSGRVVNDDTAGYNSSPTPILFRAGERLSAMTLLKATNLQLGPILATLAEGEFAGAELMGTVSAGDEVLNFNFTSMWLPDEQIRIPINAIALSFDDQMVGTQTDVNHRYFKRFFLKPVLEGAAAAGAYYANDESTTVTNNAGVVVESKAAKTADTARKVALGKAAETASEAIGELDTRTIVTQDRHTPIVIMFMTDVTRESLAKSTGSTSSSNLNTQSLNVQNANVGSTNSGSNITQSTGASTESTVTLTKAEAMALRNTEAAKDPRIQAAIQKALSN